jgi:hypothetical protein
MAAKLDSIQPYIEHLFDDAEVQKHLSRATVNLRGAKSRAGKAKSKKKALKDATLRQRLIDGAQAMAAAGAAINKAPEKQARRGRRRGLLLITALGAGAVVAANAGARARVRGLIGAGETETAGT